MKKIWHDEAWETYVFWQNQDKKTLNLSNVDLIMVITKKACCLSIV